MPQEKTAYAELNSTYASSARDVQSKAVVEDTKITVEIPENTSLNEPNSSVQKSLSIGTSAKDLYQNDIEELPCLVYPIIQKVGLMALAGSSDTGKSCLLRQLAIDIATGYNSFIGFELRPEHNRAIMVSTEDDYQSTSVIIKKQAMGVEEGRLENLRFVFNDDNLLERLDHSLSNEPVDLIVIDCFADIFGQDLKETHRLRNCLNEYQNLAHKHQCLIIFLHHTGKRTEDLIPSKNNLLSGQGFEAKMRLVVEIRADKHQAQLRHFCIVKGNYLSSEFKNESFGMHFDKETLRFYKTDIRLSFDELSKKKDDEEVIEKYHKMKELKAKGMTLEQIATDVGYASKGTVSKIIKKGDEKGW
jgi:RecA-family ATPase